MPQSNKKLLKSTPKFYKRDEHLTLTGLCIHQDWITVDEKGNIKQQHIILTSRDLYFKGKEKIEYRENNKK